MDKRVFFCCIKGRKAWLIVANKENFDYFKTMSSSMYQNLPPAQSGSPFLCYHHLQFKSVELDTKFISFSFTIPNPFPYESKVILLLLVLFSVQLVLHSMYDPVTRTPYNDMHSVHTSTNYTHSHWRKFDKFRPLCTPQMVEYILTVRFYVILIVLS